MVDKNVLNDEFGGFDNADSETFALEALTAYPGDSEGFIIPKPQVEVSQTEIPVQKTEIPEQQISHYEQPIKEDEPIEEIISIDDDLLRALQMDLMKSRQKKELSGEEQPAIDQQDFIEIDDDSITETIDLGDIKAQHPSSFMVHDEVAQTAAEIPDVPDSSGYGGYGGYAAMAQDMGGENGDTVPPVVEENRKKEKKAIPFLNRKTLLIAASIAGIAVLGASAYFLTPAVKGVFASKDTDSTTVEHGIASAKKEDHHEAKPEHKADAHDEVKTHSNDKAITEIPDSLLNEIADDTKHEEHGTEAKHHNEAEAHENPKAVATKHEPEKHAEPKHEPKQIKEKHPLKEHKATKEHIVEHKEKSEKKHNSASLVEKHPKKHAVPKQESHEQHAAHEPKQKVEEIPSKKEQATTSDKKEIKPLFTIQVYATPSKNEAERWLNKLRSSSANAPVITTQQIRDKTWYRVRFGNFTTRDDAEKAIRNLGYDQCWIDRVR